MQPNLWKRLNKVEESFCPNESKNGIVFFPLEDESDEAYDERIARWKSGEKVDGMDREYTGSEMIGIVRFVSAKKRGRIMPSK